MTHGEMVEGRGGTKMEEEVLEIRHGIKGKSQCYEAKSMGRMSGEEEGRREGE